MTARSIAHRLTRHPLNRAQSVRWDAQAAAPRNEQLPVFTQTIVLSDGATLALRTTSPRTYMQLTKDTTNHPVWRPHLAAVEDASSEITRFQQRLSRASAAPGEPAEGTGLDDFFA